MSDTASTGDKPNDAANEETAKLVRKPPHLLNVQFGGQWSAALPTVYRYEDKQWIDLFFNEGKLRLGSFARFAKYPDEQRGDTAEGKGVSFGFGANSTVAIAHSQGHNAYVLCGSLAINRAIQTDMGRDSAFAIENTLGFAVEVARQLPGFRDGFEGHCIYRPSTTINREFAIDMEKYKLPDGGINMQMIFDAGAGLGGPERMLLKRKKYEPQREYRLMWFVDLAQDEFIDITCPNAVQHCRRVQDDEYLD